MPQVNLASKNSFEDIEHLAIAIKGDIEQRDIGILFRPHDDDLQMIHLGWQNDLRCHEAKSSYCWIPCDGINQIVLANIADWLATVWQVNRSAIPYSIKPFDEDPFDETGKLKRREPGDGFTCATFVLWVFRHSEIDLIDKDSWRDRSEDQEWRERIVATLKQSVPDAQAHIEAQREYIYKAARYRPEEVAGAAGEFSGTPIGVDEAISLGNDVLHQMSLYGRL